MRKLWEIGMLLFAAAGFWGMIYPDLCFVSDVCNVECVYEDAYGQDGEEEGGEILDGQRDGSMNYEEKEAGNRSLAGEPDIYTRICKAELGQIRVKSRLLELFRK